jgi:hypothetical protein
MNVQKLFELATDRAQNPVETAEARLHKLDDTNFFRVPGITGTGAVYNLAKALGRIHRLNQVIEKNKFRAAQAGTELHPSDLARLAMLNQERAKVRFYAGLAGLDDAAIEADVLPIADRSQRIAAERMVKYGR